MKYTKIPESAFEEIQLNAGVVCSGFDPKTGEITGIIGASSGGWNFTATPSFSDWGEDIDNCPKNTMELKKLESWEVKMSGTYVTLTPISIKSLVAAAEVNEGQIIPRNDVRSSDFSDLWWVGDYGSDNEGDSAGFIAIHMMNTLSTGGFQIQSTDKAKGKFSAEYTAHYSMSATEKVPFEVYVYAGGARETVSDSE